MKVKQMTTTSTSPYDIEEDWDLARRIKHCSNVNHLPIDQSPTYSSLVGCSHQKCNLTCKFLINM